MHRRFSPIVEQMGKLNVEKQKYGISEENNSLYAILRNTKK